MCESVCVWVPGVLGWLCVTIKIGLIPYGLLMFFVGGSLGEAADGNGSHYYWLPKEIESTRRLIERERRQLALTAS